MIVEKGAVKTSPRSVPCAHERENFVGEWKNGKEFNGRKYDKGGNIIGNYVNGVIQ